MNVNVNDEDVNVNTGITHILLSVDAVEQYTDAVMI
jgi:hypothetical protein